MLYVISQPAVDVERNGIEETELFDVSTKPCEDHVYRVGLWRDERVALLDQQLVNRFPCKA